MKWLLLIAGLGAASFAANSKTKPTRTTPKHATAKPKSSTKADLARKAEENSTLAKSDKICRYGLASGKLDAVRARCADLAPENSAIATYWRLTLTDDPNDLRKGFAPATLAKGDVDARLLLVAGRYHFARGQIHEMEDLVGIARKLKLKGPEIDTLNRLAAGT